MASAGVEGTATWTLAWRFAKRELRGGVKGFRIFLACLILGVAAIATVGTVGQSFSRGLAESGSEILGGDVDLRLSHRWASEAQETFLAETSAALSKTVEMRAMARPVSPRPRRSLVELKAVDDAYPLVGTVETTPAKPLKELLAFEGGNWGAAVDGYLLTRLRVTVGEVVKVGEATFQIRAVIDREPDRVASPFSFGPRFLIADDALPATELMKPGSQTRHHYRLALPDDATAAAFRNQAQDQFPHAGWRIRTPDEAAPGVRRFIQRMTLFLTFVGLTVLLVGGVGVTQSVKTYLESRLGTIAMLKCLGAPGGFIFRVYFLQVLALGVIGTAAGLLIGAILPYAGLAPIADNLPVRPVFGLYPAPLLTALGFGLTAAVTFALWPLATARETPSQDLFRARIAPAGRRPRLGYLLAMAAGIAALGGLTLATASDKVFAGWFVAGALATLLILQGAAHGVRVAAARVKKPPSARWRLVFANMARPGSSVPGIMTSLGLSLAVLVAVGLIEANLSRQVEQRLPDQAPAFFFLDIQPDQVAAFDEAVNAVDGTMGFKRVPSLRGRITAINGINVADAFILPESRWAVQGDRALTYAETPPDASEVIAGEWWSADYQGPPLISLDAGIAKGFGVGVGDTLSINVLGRPVTAEIASLRDINWRSLRFDFAIIFDPATLKGAPHTHVAAIEAPGSAEEEIERRVADGFPNVSAIRVREALAAVARLLAGVGLAVTGTAAITVVAGTLVLAGTIAAGHQKRVYEAIVFKVLGADRRRIVETYLREYLVLAAATAVIGSGVGIAAAYGVVVHLMRTDWALAPPVVGWTAALCVAVTLVAGLIGTWRALGEKAAPHLRND